MLVPRIHLQYAAQAGSDVEVIRSYGDYSYAMADAGRAERGKRGSSALREPKFADPFDALVALLGDMG